MLKLSDAGRRTPAPSPPPGAVRKPATPAVVPAVAKPPVAVAKKPAAPAPSAPKAAAPRKAKNSRLLLIATGLLGVLALIVSATVFMGSSEPKPAPLDLPATSAESVTSSVRVAAPGLVEAESGLLKLAFEIPGTLRCVKAAEGESVRTGQIIAELENEDLIAKVDAARADLRLAESQLKSLEVELDADIQRAQQDVARAKADLALLKAGARPEEIARARAEVSAAEAEANRTAEDAAKFANPQAIQSGAWSVQQRDNTKRLAETAAAKLNAARETLRALENGSRQEDIDKAQAALAAAEANCVRAQASRAPKLEAGKAQIAGAQGRLALAEAELGKSVLRAPLSGTVIWKYHFAGETLSALTTEPILALADLSRLRVRAEIDEADFRHVRTGQAVTVTSDAFPGRKFRAHLTSIGSSAGQKKFSTGESKERMDVNVIEALVHIDEPSGLKLGSRVTAFFEPAEKEPAACKSN